LFVSLGSLAGVVGAYAILIPLTINQSLAIDYLLYAFGRHGDDNLFAPGEHCEPVQRHRTQLGQRAEKVRAHSGHQNKKT